MRRLLLTLLLAAAAMSVGPGAAGAAPCYTVGGVCQHWADFNRATPGQVEVYAYNTSANWQNAIATERTYFNGAVSNVKVGQTVIRSDNVCSAFWAFKHNLCQGTFPGATCGTLNTAWDGCTTTYISYNSSGTISPHQSAIVTRVKEPTTYTDGSARTYVQANRTSIVCHEMLGHGYGMNHTDTDPGTNSCLYHINTEPPPGSVLNSTITGQIFANHNHNDGAGEYAGIGMRKALSPKAKKKLSVLKLKKVKGNGPSGEDVYLVPGKAGEYDVKSLPKGPLYIALSRTDGYLKAPAPLWQRFTP